MGANTRASLDKIQQLSNEEDMERGFALLLCLEQREFMAIDVSNQLENRGLNKMGYGFSDAVLSLQNPSKHILIGFGHTHPDEAQISKGGSLNPSINNPSMTSDDPYLKPQDYHPFGIRNPYTDHIGYNPSIIATSFGFTVYRTAHDTNIRGRYDYSLPHLTSPIFKY